ncbi:MAG: NAD(P)/FAD-dependent oxidoreductase [Flavihumibacter sp.]|nr:NAD(P)/FAD-dependent oxidoreductase [Flavihumibacter sp.]
MRLVIVGGGFGGLRLARKLNNKPGISITLLDRFNYHQFQPLFYQVATAGLDASNISFPLRKVFHNSKNVRIRVCNVSSINTQLKQVLTDAGNFEYDVLVIATGASTNFFNNDQLARHAFPMKSTIEALQLRYRLLQNFEKALDATNDDVLRKLLTTVVVGGGPTGVEVAGAIAEMKKYVLPNDYPELDFSKMKIYLIEGSHRTLAAMSDASSKRSMHYLQQLGVEVVTGTVVKDYDGELVTLSNNTTISSATVIWAAGIKGNVPAGIDPSLIARGNRIKVDAQNKVMNTESVYAVGDVAYMETDQYANGHPQVAPVAIQQADTLAKNLLALQKGVPAIKQFVYKDKGAMATVGRNLAVVDIPKPKLHLGGFIAWLIWMGLHLMLILGVKNRFFVFSNWLYNYITYDQSLRLIFKEFNRQQNGKE